MESFLRTEGCGRVSWLRQGKSVIPSDLTTYKGKGRRGGEEDTHDKGMPLNISLVVVLF